MLSENLEIESITTYPWVLILIVLEDALWDYENSNKSNRNFSVLILIVLEDALWEFYQIIEKLKLNFVLILIVLEDALWEIMNEFMYLY